MSGWTEGVKVYSNDEFTVANSTTDYDVETNESLFSDHGIGTARFIQIRTDQEITVKFNETTNDAITVPAGEIWQNEPNRDRLKITNIFISNASGAIANVKIFITP